MDLFNESLASEKLVTTTKVIIICMEFKFCSDYLLIFLVNLKKTFLLTRNKRSGKSLRWKVNSMGIVLVCQKWKILENFADVGLWTIFLYASLSNLIFVNIRNDQREVCIIIHHTMPNGRGNSVLPAKGASTRVGTFAQYYIHPDLLTRLPVCSASD